MVDTLALPNVVIAGVNKAGTTSLFAALRRHPDVATSDIKETCFFLPVRYGEPLPPLREYSAHFPRPGAARVLLEATPGYFYGGRALADNLAAAVPGVRIIVVLREPVSRLVSFFRFQKAMLTLPADMDLATYVATCDRHDPDQLLHRRELNRYFGVEGGHYYKHLPAWQDVFGDRLKIMFFDDLVADPGATMLELAAWLGISGEPWSGNALERENRTVAPRRRVVHRAAMAVNRALERPLRRHPEVKSKLRAAYGRLNTRPATDVADPAVRAALAERYAPGNQLLRGQLPIALRIPEWLAEG